MEGNRKRTPIPKREIEQQEAKENPVVTCTLSDPVNHPAHYTAGDVECIEAIKSAVVGMTGMEAYCTGSVMKYMWRWKQKNGKEDLQKAGWYLERLLREK